MKTRSFKFWFKGGPIVVWAFNEEDASILARAEAIKKGWNSEIIPQPKLEPLNIIINWNQLTEDEQGQLYALLCKAKYNGQMEDV